MQAYMRNPVYGGGLTSKDLRGTPSRVTCRDASCLGLGAYGDVSRPTLDVTEHFPSQTLTAMKNVPLQWLSPVESGTRLPRSGNTTLFAAVPGNWTSGSGVLVGELTTTGSVGIRSVGVIPEGPPPPQLAAEPGETLENSPPVPVRVSPGARTKAGAALLASENAVLLISGRRAGVPEPLRDFWRLDLGSGVWSRVLRDALPRPHEVQAVAYDSASRRLFVLDEFEGLLGLRAIRLMSYDMRTGTGTLHFQIPRIGVYRRLSLTAQDDGTLLLGGTLTGLEQTHVYRLDTRGTLRWLGFSVFIGAMADVPVNTSDGVFYALLTLGQQRVRSIKSADLGLPVVCTGF